jgi:uncharacterized protein (DUF2164 family)
MLESGTIHGIRDLLYLQQHSNCDKEKSHLIVDKYSTKLGNYHYRRPLKDLL